MSRASVVAETYRRSKERFLTEYVVQQFNGKGVQCSVLCDMRMKFLAVVSIIVILTMYLPRTCSQYLDKSPYSQKPLFGPYHIIYTRIRNDPCPEGQRKDPNGICRILI